MPKMQDDDIDPMEVYNAEVEENLEDYGLSELGESEEDSDLGSNKVPDEIKEDAPEIPESPEATEEELLELEAALKDELLDDDEGLVVLTGAPKKKSDETGLDAEPLPGFGSDEEV